MKSFPFEEKDIIQAYLAETDRKADAVFVEKTLNRPLSIVARIRIVLQDGTAEQVYLKYYRSKQGESTADVVRRDYATSLFWWGRFKESSQFSVIQPLWKDEEKGVLITRESEGVDLQTALNRGKILPGLFRDRASMSEMMRLTGGWLKYFQNISPEDIPANQPTLDYILNYIAIRMDRIVEKTNIGFDRRLQDRVNRYLENAWARTTDQDRQAVYLHSDFSLSNVLYAPGRVTVLDFTKRETGSAYKDLTRFYHQLLLLSFKPAFSKSFVRTLQHQFLKGYGDEAIEGHPMFKIFLMIHYINHLGKSARFWEQSTKGKLYNYWVVYNVMKLIKAEVDFT
ncbi:MAG: hypothetical protein D6677_14260 [Calditrichaeota bacterium]|nr:MAG: hypothetical protein D6677_14260 [Calditrichota bacterium]